MDVEEKKTKIEDINKKLYADIERHHALGEKQEIDFIKLFINVEIRDDIQHIYSMVRSCMNEKQSVEDIDLHIMFIKAFKRYMKKNVDLTNTYLNNLEKLELIKANPNLMEAFRDLLDEHMISLRYIEIQLENKHKDVIASRRGEVLRV
ncbi:uncharacterized protein BdWA1_004067 [Babesia duncani]|uniref:Uncharacterized protein n=1 Tax=Babesia duncani TaxID=323732 RepID=A0AAD9UM86_9APIC|nr:hypothetical protein BdWA1_004115 [Babesia duncani]KAK2194462.1 hypothetical protein BdWA1_004067 [Babesia duncani]